MRRLGIALSFLLSITASAANDLTGVVVRASVTPVSGAHVYVYTAFPRIGVSALCPHCYRDCGKHEPVDGKGAFRLKALDPTLLFDVLAVADGYEPAFARRIDPMRGPVTIELTPRSTADAGRLITGVVVDPNGKPVVGALVEPNGYRFERSTGDGRFTRSVGYGDIPGVEKLSITNTKGEFALRIPEPTGELDVRVTARSLAPNIERMLAPGERRTIRLTEGATISGHILREGKPVAGARVVFVQQNRASSGYLGRREIGTNGDGLFVMTNLGPNESYIVYAPMEGVSRGVVEAKIVSVGDTETVTDAGTLAIVQGCRVAGTIIVPEGASIPPRTEITLTTDLTDDSRSVEVRADRTFVFNAVPTDAVQLTIRIPGLKLSPGSTRSTPRGAFSGSRRRPYGVVLPAEGDSTNLRLVFESQ